MNLTSATWFQQVRISLGNNFELTPPFFLWYLSHPCACSREQPSPISAVPKNSRISLVFAPIETRDFRLEGCWPTKCKSVQSRNSRRCLFLSCLASSTGSSTSLSFWSVCSSVWHSFASACWPACAKWLGLSDRPLQCFAWWNIAHPLPLGSKHWRHMFSCAIEPFLLLETMRNEKGSPVALTLTLTLTLSLSLTVTLTLTWTRTLTLTLTPPYPNPKPTPHPNPLNPSCCSKQWEMRSIARTQISFVCECSAKPIFRIFSIQISG